MNKLTKHIPDWHAEAAAELNRDFKQVESLLHDAHKRSAYLGLKFHFIKEKGKGDKSIPHGLFQAWLKQNCPQIPLSSVGYYMTEAKSLCERMGWQISKIWIFETPPHLLLLAAPTDLKPAEKKQQQLLLDLVEGKGKFQRVTTYNQVEEGEDAGEQFNKLGRAKGEGGRLPQPKVDIAEIVAFNEKRVLGQIGRVADGLDNLGVNFMSQSDDILLAWQSKIERTNRCVNEWLKTPLAKRNREAMEKVQALYHTL
jgi:hypothetical protein